MANIQRHVRHFLHVVLPMQVGSMEGEYLVTMGTKDFFGSIYPELFHNASSFYSTYSTSTQDCIPYCLSDNWRTKVTNPILLNAVANVTLVPVWRQLMSVEEYHT
jgi:hypothetical protein